MAIKREPITNLGQYLSIHCKKNPALNNDFFGNDNRENLHWGKMFLNMFGEFHSAYRYKINADYNKIIEELRVKYDMQPNQIIKIDNIEKHNFSGIERAYSEYLLIPGKSLMVAVHDEGILVYYGAEISIDSVMEIKGIADKHWIQKVNKKSFQMITMTGKELELTDFDLQKCEIDIGLNYNEDFIDIDQLIKKSITENDKKGLILLHGTPGTGKTSYIRHLISSIEKQQFIYLPNYLIENLNSPDFLPFIAANCKNSILILEDCETAMMDRNGVNRVDITALSTLLNLGDGLLADALSLKVLCTFNANLQKIDDALLRKGRLIARYEFKELETFKAQKLADSLKKDVVIVQPMTLADIYNIDTRSFENQKMRKVGFGMG